MWIILVLGSVPYSFFVTDSGFTEEANKAKLFYSFSEAAKTSLDVVEKTDHIKQVRIINTEWFNG